jgi:hypothetical protein
MPHDFFSSAAPVSYKLLKWHAKLTCSASRDRAQLPVTGGQWNLHGLAGAVSPAITPFTAFMRSLGTVIARL